uniref:Uncharacterized protein n=2 Tax=Aegilops tauschii subsp. strangulata TaxID=200361 RepID=A0A453GFZ4_AEGTS
QSGVQLFLRWAIMQGIAMHLHNRYQRQRLRTQIALGKVRPSFDLTSSGCFSSCEDLSFPNILQFPVFTVVEENFVTHFFRYDLLIVDFI